MMTSVKRTSTKKPKMSFAELRLLLEQKWLVLQNSLKVFIYASCARCEKCQRIESAVALLAGGPKVAGSKSFQICSTQNSLLQLPTCGHFKGLKIHLLPIHYYEMRASDMMIDIATFLTEG